MDGTQLLLMFMNWPWACTKTSMIQVGELSREHPMVNP